ncbi:hypothetical protein KIH45_16580 [Croceicoccus sp. 1NDH52]|nr:hypothetical protein [Croceicoccus gelatinilyticus]
MKRTVLAAAVAASLLGACSDASSEVQIEAEEPGEDDEVLLEGEDDANPYDQFPVENWQIFTQEDLMTDEVVTTAEQTFYADQFQFNVIVQCKHRYNGEAFVEIEILSFGEDGEGVEFKAGHGPVGMYVRGSVRLNDEEAHPVTNLNPDYTNQFKLSAVPEDIRRIRFQPSLVSGTPVIDMDFSEPGVTSLISGCENIPQESAT